MDFSKLAFAPRLLITATLKPVLGTRFQPTGFPDLGAATYKTAGGKSMLLVESAQSMANRLEAVTWDANKNDWVEPLKGLPFVAVVDKDKKPLTNSVLEAHRLNSLYIKRSDRGAFHKKLIEEIAYDESKPIDYPRFTATLLKYDVNCLIHGVFLESIAGRLRIPRILTSFIEASEVEVAASGGVKNDHIDPSKKIKLPPVDKDVSTDKDEERRGNVPFHRDEFTGNITAFFNIDLAQIRGYGLGKEVEELLYAIALYKVRALLDTPFRPRTACDLDLDKLTILKPESGFSLPSLADLSAALPKLIQACASHFAQPATTTVAFE